MTPEVIGGDRQIVWGEPLHSFRGAAVTGTDPPTPRDTSKECRALFLVGSWHSQRAVEVDMGCGRSPKVRIHFWTPPKGSYLGSKVAGAGARAHETACPAPSCIASSPLSPDLCYFLLFPSFSEHGAVMRAQGATRGVQREEVASSGVLWDGAPCPSSAVSSVSWPQLPSCRQELF